MRQQLAGIRKRGRNAAVRRVLTRAGRMCRKQARARVPVRHGNLKKALAYKVGVYNKGKDGLKAFAVIGPDKAYRVPAGIKSRGENEGTPWFFEPWRYNHLVEFGTVHSRGSRYLTRAAHLTAAAVPQIVKEEIARAMYREMVAARNKAAGRVGK
jgi:HK97 gp10 family phage protein